ncbi:MAG: hypothetical protein DCC64_00750 [Planctomycetota bacterium]|nr:MAG: hypothetical protein DCC64_00750 [Planctomycetota bacterium]
MKSIPLKDARPGMVLNRQIEDSLGRTLVAAGEKLSPELIRVLMRRGYAEVEIRDDAALVRGAIHGAAEDASAGTDQLRAELDARFGPPSADEYRQMLCRAAWRVLSERMQAAP